jgi:hypothetical protein
MFLKHVETSWKPNGRSHWCRTSQPSTVETVSEIAKLATSLSLLSAHWLSESLRHAEKRMWNRPPPQGTPCTHGGPSLNHPGKVYPTISKPNDGPFMALALPRWSTCCMLSQTGTCGSSLATETLVFWHITRASLDVGFVCLLTSKPLHLRRSGAEKARHWRHVLQPYLGLVSLL